MTQATVDSTEFNQIAPAGQDAAPPDAGRTVDLGPLWLLLVALLATVAGWFPGRVLLPNPASTDLREHRMATEIAPGTHYAADRLKTGLASLTEKSADENGSKPKPVAQKSPKDTSGGIPLWNPHAGLGAPLLGNGEVGVFYPTILLHMALPEKWAWPVSAAVCLWTAGIGMWWLARRWGLSPAGRLMAGIAFMLCGANVVWLNHPIGQTVAPLPLGLALLHRLMSGGGVLTMSLLALVTAAAVAAGRPDASIAFVAVLLLGWAAMCAGTAGMLEAESVGITWPRALLALPMLLGAVAVGLLLSGAQWVTYIEYVRDWGTEAFRQGRHAPAARSLASLLGIASPQGVGLDRASGWIGIAALVLAVLGLIRSASRGSAAWLVLIVICIALACTGVADRLAWKRLALGWNFAPVLMGAAALGFAMLAGMGLESIIARRQPTDEYERPMVYVGMGIWFVVVLGLAYAAHFLMHRQHVTVTSTTSPSATSFVAVAEATSVGGPSLWSYLLQAAAVAGAWGLYRAGAGARGWIGIVAIECIGMAIVANPGSNAALHARPSTRPPGIDVNADDALVPPRMRMYLSESEPTPTTRPATIQLQAAKLGTEPSRVSRAWIAKTGRQYTDARTAFAASAKPNIDPQNFAIVDSGFGPEYDSVREPKDAQFTNIQRDAVGVSGRPTIEWIEDSPERIRLTIKDGTGGWLVLADPFSPGWRATMVWALPSRSYGSGQKERDLERDAFVFPAFGFLRAVALPAHGPEVRRGGSASGPYEVVFEYFPRGWKHGRLVSLAGALVLLMMAAGKLISDRFTTPESNPQVPQS